MKKQLILVTILGFMMFVSCKKDEEVKPAEVQQPAQPFSGEAWLKQRVGIQGQAQQQPMQQNSQQQNSQQSMSTPAQTAPGMNPPHGQPGHKCEIPVGAPLNSKPAVNKQQQTTTQVQKPVEKPVMNVNTNNGAATIVGTTTPPGMNPPHGQEGHRCDVAVGAPLPKE
jgi:hypothetical protein